jgi:RNA-directed DNA polymerase
LKRFSNLYENIYKPENIKACYREVMRNTKNKRQVYKLQNNADNVIRTIYEELKNEKYVVGKYNVFIIYEPKQRKIVSQGMKDKIVNHLIAREILYPAILPCLVPFNVASRPGMGTKKALEYLERYRRQFAAKNEKYFMLKCDISRFFLSIDHKILKKKVRRRIKDPRALKIVFNVIDSYSTGIGIGSMTSQVLAIFYLNDLDHFIKEKLKIKGYIRYQDDFLLFSESKEYLEVCLEKIKKFLEKEKLTLNGKTRIYSCNENICFLGRNLYGQYAKRRTVRRKMKKRFYLLKEGKISLDSYIASRICYKNLMRKS